MNSNTLRTQLNLHLLWLVVAATPSLLGQSHSHFNAGAPGTTQGTPLVFANAGDFAPATSYVKTLIYTNAGKYVGTFQGNITLTALPRTAANAGPDPLAPAAGSFIQASIVSVQGPVGGQFAFWESGATKATFMLTSGSTATNLWRLSENNGSPGSDPYGHIHGRRFTATLPGVYTVGFQCFDTSTNGVAGGPIHQPSPIAHVRFQAGVTMDYIEPDYEEGHVHVRFGAMEGYLWQLEASPTVAPSANWTPAGEPVVGADVFIQTIHDVPPGDRRFYRVTGTPIIP